MLIWRGYLPITSFSGLLRRALPCFVMLDDIIVNAPIVREGSDVAYRWRYENVEGTVVVPDLDVAYDDFDSQTEAESWLGEMWQALLDSGVHQVLLLEDGAVVYGPMSLYGE